MAGMSAADGIVAIDAIARAKPDVAVVDLGLPGKDGIALTRELKATADPPRVVILTMHEMDDEVLAALSAGADAYCVKSSDPGVVIDAIRAVAAGGAPMVKDPVGGGEVVVAVNLIDWVVPSGMLSVMFN